MRFLLATAVILAAVAAIAASAHGQRVAPQDTGRLELIASVHRVTVKAVSVTGLYPGAVKPVAVTVTNGEKFKIKVAALKVAVAVGTNRVGCAGTAVNLVATAPKGTVKLAPKKKHTYVLNLTMPRTVADACQGAKFKITVKAHATR